MSDVTIYDGITGEIGVSVSDGIVKYSGVSIRKVAAGAVIPPFSNAYWTNDAKTNRYYTDDALANPLFTDGP